MQLERLAGGPATTQGYAPQLLQEQACTAMVATDPAQVEEYPVDTWSADFVPPSKLKQFVVLPPRGQDVTRDQLADKIMGLAPEGRSLLKDELPLVHGFTAALDDRSKAALESEGYAVVSDDVDRFLLPQPADKKVSARSGDSVENMPDAGRTEQRPAMTEPRYASALTQRYTGRGVAIAFLDTGIYPHPDFTSPNDRIVAFKDFVNNRSIPYDDNGHGTHVAGDVAGNGFCSQGLYRGPAPQASMVGVKVLNRSGQGRMSDILKGINWVVEHKDQYGIRVMNLSLGNRAKKDYENDPIERAVEKAVEAGLVVTVAAGNEGPEPGTISAPGDNPRVITVGAVDDNNTRTLSDDRIPGFSSRGPTLAGFSKPDVLAPGEEIIGPNAPVTPTEEQAQHYNQMNETLQWLQGMNDADLAHVPADTLKLIGLTDETIEQIKGSAQLARQEIDRVIRATDRTPMIDTSYVGSPGTSMATPIVAGVVAEMLEADPNLTPDQVKEILKDTSSALPNQSPNSQGAGEINPQAALAKVLALKGEPNYQTTLDDYINEARIEASRAPIDAGTVPPSSRPQPPAQHDEDGYIVKR